MRLVRLQALALLCALLGACAYAPVEERGPSLVVIQPARMPEPEPEPKPPPPPVAPEPPATPAEMEARQVIQLLAYVNRLVGMTPEEQRKELAAANQDFARDPGPRTRLRLALLLALPGTPVSDHVRAALLLEPLAGSGAATPLRQFAALLHAQVSERVREERRNAQLKEQIEALRNIERSLIEREKGEAKSRK